MTFHSAETLVINSGERKLVTAIEQLSLIPGSVAASELHPALFTAGLFLLGSNLTLREKVEEPIQFLIANINDPIPPHFSLGMFGDPNRYQINKGDIIAKVKIL